MFLIAQKFCTKRKKIRRNAIWNSNELINNRNFLFVIIDDVFTRVNYSETGKTTNKNRQNQRR